MSTASVTISRQSHPQPLSGSKNRAILACFQRFVEPQTSVWGFLNVLIFNVLAMFLRKISYFLNFCILTPLFDTTLLFHIWSVGFIPVPLSKKGQYYGTNFGTVHV